MKEITNEDEEFNNIKDYINKLTLIAYGKIEELDKFYVYNSLNNFYLKCKNIITDSNILAKLFYAACNAAVDYIHSPNKEVKDNILFELIQFNKDNIYKASNDNNLQLILNLTKKSFLYPYFLQFNSAFKASQTLMFDKQYVITCMTSMITLNQIKLDLIKCLPQYGIRTFFNTDYLTNTIINTDITIYNEKKIFGYFLNQNELLCENDKNYIRRVRLSFLQKYERFIYYKKFLNKTKNDFMNYPRGIVNYEEDRIFILASKRDLEQRRNR